MSVQKTDEKKRSLPDGSGARKKRDPDFDRPVMAILVARVRGDTSGAGSICIAGVNRSRETSDTPARGRRIY